MKQLLTDEELRFLSDQGLSPDDVYDGRNETSRLRSKNAKTADKRIVLRNSSPMHCGHRLISRSGNCVQCNTSALSYGSRDAKEAFVYIAASKTLNALKLGSTEDPYHRAEMLTSQRYAAVKDWNMLFYVKIKRSGEVERTAQAFLSDQKISVPYQRDGREQIAGEVFRCDYSTALDAISKAAQKLKIKPKGAAFQKAGAKTFLS